jgi:hypothetical protein
LYDIAYLIEAQRMGLKSSDVVRAIFAEKGEKVSLRGPAESFDYTSSYRADEIGAR